MEAETAGTTLPKREKHIKAAEDPVVSEGETTDIESIKSMLRKDEMSGDKEDTTKPTDDSNKSK